VSQPPASRTLVAAHLGVQHRDGTNLVYSAGLGLAWRELARLAGGPLTLVDAAADEPAQALVRALQESQESGLDEGAYLARAGMHSRELVNEILGELERRFGAEAAPRLLAEPPAPGLFLAYAFVAKRLVFDPPLIRESWAMTFPFGARHPSFVHSFGVWETRDEPPELWAARARELLIHHPRWTEDEYAAMSDEDQDRVRDDESFVVEILPSDRADRVIVARIPPGATLAETVRAALAQVSDDAEGHPRAHLAPDERFQVPCVDVDLAGAHPELEGRLFSGPRIPRGVLGEVIQDVRFHLDEGGVALQTEARLRGLCLPPRDLVCDRPFLVLLLRRGSAVPYLAVWIENDEILVPAPEPALPA
jgi:hypothetical protein